MKKDYIFDLDGTLADTLPDIRDAVNESLLAIGREGSCSLEDVRKMIGRGARNLGRLALGGSPGEEELSSFMREYMPRYRDYQGRTTKPFPGVTEALLSLRERGARLFVCTNKPHELAVSVLKKIFPGGLFDDVQGHVEGRPPKPDPWLLDALFKRNGIKKEEALFVGDSLPDKETADNYGLPLVLCLWGYGNYDSSLLMGASKIIRSPVGLLDPI